jgi:gliding motility-associated protein GldM
MGGAKETPRQKMISLMYLVLIAMLALNMSKEVLSAFGLMDEKFENANALISDNNSKTLASLVSKGEEKPKEFALAADKAKQITTISKKFDTYIASVKAEILKGGEFEIDPDTGKLPFDTMDKGDFIDELWFTGDKLSKKGQAVMETINKYKADIKSVVGNDVKYTIALENFDKKFNTESIKAKDGANKLWLDYHFKGFPAIASITKLTAMQNDVKTTEANMFNLFLGNTLDSAVSLKNYQAIVLADKSAFFAGEKFQGKVVLGKYADVTPTKLMVNGQEIDLSKAIDSTGAARLDFNVGNVGEQKIDGEFTFLEDGKPLPIKIVGNYVVVPRPNSATISADKMNVVYRGLQNPMTISFAGVPDNKVSASGSGLKKTTGQGKYVVTPGSGRELKINVSATLDDGSKASDSQVFRIKDIPKPTGTFNGQMDTAKLPRSNVEIGRVGALLPDFVFDLDLQVTSFKFKVPGQATINCNGTRLSGTAKAALRKAKRGSTVQFFDIKAKIKGNSIKLKGVSPVIIELTN